MKKRPVIIYNKSSFVDSLKKGGCVAIYGGLDALSVGDKVEYRNELVRWLLLSGLVGLRYRLF